MTAPSQSKRWLIVLLVITAPLWIIPLVALTLWYLAKLFWVFQPALYTLQERGRHWLTWHEIKRLTGLSTWNTFEFLSIAGSAFDCRLRTKATIIRIDRLQSVVSYHATEGDEPMFLFDTIYYEFRLKGGGQRRRLRDRVQDSLPALLAPQPTTH